MMKRKALSGSAIVVSLLFTAGSTLTQPAAAQPAAAPPAKPRVTPRKVKVAPRPRPAAAPKAAAPKAAAPKAAAPKAASAKGPATPKTTPSPNAAACPPGAICEETSMGPPLDEGAPPDAATSAPASPTGDEGPPAGAAAPGPTSLVIPPAAPGRDPNAPRTFTYRPDPNGGQGQIIVHEHGLAGPGAYPTPPPPPPKPRHQKKWRRHRQWGGNVRLQGVLQPRPDHVDADVGMAGIGLGVRYRPVPMFALAIGADFLGGTDANGLERREMPFELSGIVYANPRSLAQFYVFGGLNWSFARVSSIGDRPNLARGDSDEYTYFGGHAGLGVEFRVSRLIGINLDTVGFIRSRTDDDGGGRFPEYYNPRTGEASNSSAAGLIRAGVTFWW